MTNTSFESDVAFIEALAELLNKSGLAELSVKREYGENDRLNVRVSKYAAQTAAQPVAVAAPSAVAAPAAPPPDTAAYEAARSAMVPGATANDAITIATELVQSADLKQVNVEVIPADITEDTGLITVRVDVPIAGNSWVTPQIFFPNATVSSEVTLMCERSPLIRLTALPALKAKKTQMNNNSGL